MWSRVTRPWWEFWGQVTVTFSRQRLVVPVILLRLYRVSQMFFPPSPPPRVVFLGMLCGPTYLPNGVFDGNRAETDGPRMGYGRPGDPITPPPPPSPLSEAPREDKGEPKYSGGIEYWAPSAAAASCDGGFCLMQP
ncbi:hypothetical protein GQ53DRAFT_156013 [Thozetella sp. PMI_491]|nr:hypothetical protein GQ53DRAFT_156013 [Thozetella sp. PMI_491]